MEIVDGYIPVKITFKRGPDTLLMPKEILPPVVSFEGVLTVFNAWRRSFQDRQEQEGSGEWRHDAV